MNAETAYQTWLQAPSLRPEDREALRTMADSPEQVRERFSSWLSFGTGGLRGRMGLGSNRMNIYTVRLATQALAAVLAPSGGTSAGVVIAYDSRNMSRQFAVESAKVLVGNGMPVFLFDQITATPILSFAVRHLGADGGIVITASHNPPEYNGYKAYGADGGQLLAGPSQAISERMAALTLEDVQLDEEVTTNPLFQEIGSSVYEAYFQAVLETSHDPRIDADNTSVLYTPLHGVGGHYVPEVLQRAGFTNTSCVAEQMQPDPEFSTVQSPNPEEAESFQLAIQEADGGRYDLLLATDPDGDRVGCAVWNGSEYQRLTGNQVGVLLTDYLLSKTEPHPTETNVVIKTIVTTEMVRPLARSYGARVIDTLTGFKYIAEQMERLEQDTHERFLFGFEESYGYLAGTFARDKDAIIAGLLIAQMVSVYKQAGLTLLGKLDELMQTHGYYLESLDNFTFADEEEAERAAKLIESLRSDPPDQLGGEAISIVRDYQSSVATDRRTQEQQTIHLPKENVIQFETDARTRVTLRPSGTEPKMKLYIGAVGKSKEEAETRLNEIRSACAQLVGAS